jgi:hypothetical protein
MQALRLLGSVLWDRANRLRRSITARLLKAASSAEVSLQSYSVVLTFVGQYRPLSANRIAKTRCINPIKEAERHSSGAKQAAERGLISGDSPQKHTSVAKAAADSIVFIPGMNPRPTARMRFFAECKAQSVFCGICGTTELQPHRRRPVDGDPGEVVP